MDGMKEVAEFAVAMAGAARGLLLNRVAAQLGKTGEIELLELLVGHGILRVDERGIIVAGDDGVLN